MANCFANALGKNMEEMGWSENNNYPEKAKRPSNWAVVGNLPSYKDKMVDFLKSSGLL